MPVRGAWRSWDLQLYVTQRWSRLRVPSRHRAGLPRQPSQRADLCRPTDTDRLGPASTRLPYGEPYDGPPESVSLDLYDLHGPAWTNPVHGARNYDTGACNLTVPYVNLASIVNQEVFPQVLHTILGMTDISRVNEATMTLEVAPVLAGYSIVGRDQIAMALTQDLAVTGVGPFGITAGVTLVGAESLTARLATTSATLPGGGTAYRIALSGVETRTEVGRTTDTYTIGAQIAQVLADTGATGFASQFNDELNRLFIIPLPVLNTFIGCHDPRNATNSNAAAGNAECRNVFGGTATGYLVAGSESGCYGYDAFSPLFQTTALTNFHNNNPSMGICANRLEPHRVNLLPEGVQIVLIENGPLDANTDPDYQFVQQQVLPQLMRMGGIASNFTVNCDVPLHPPLFLPPPSHAIGSVGTLRSGSTAQCACASAETCTTASTAAMGSLGSDCTP